MLKQFFISCIFMNNLFIYFLGAVANKGVLGKEFKKDAKGIIEYLEKLSLEDVDTLEKELQDNG